MKKTVAWIVKFSYVTESQRIYPHEFGASQKRSLDALADGSWFETKHFSFSFCVSQRLACFQLNSEARLKEFMAAVEVMEARLDTCFSRSTAFVPELKVTIVDPDKHERFVARYRKGSP